MARCLRCKAGNEWIEGRVPDDDGRADRDRRTIDYLTRRVEESKDALRDMEADRDDWKSAYLAMRVQPERGFSGVEALSAERMRGQVHVSEGKPKPDTTAIVNVICDYGCVSADRAGPEEHAKRHRLTPGVQ